MRNQLVLLGMVALGACSGGGPQTVGSNAAPTGSGTTGGTTGTGTASQHTFVTPTVAKTYNAIGGVQSYQYSTGIDSGVQSGQLYAGDASTARNSSITVSYDPRDAIFEIQIASTKAGVNDTLRFQDPAHRTDFGGAKQPQGGVPNLNSPTDLGVRFLQSGSSKAPLTYDPAQSATFAVGDVNGATDTSTFFYQKPGTATSYVTFAGFVRNAETITQIAGPNNSTLTRQNYTLERAAFVFGERTDNNAVPKTGTASFSGAMLATMVYNPLLDVDPTTPTYYQWISGTANANVDFAAGTVATTFAGTVGDPLYDVYTSHVHALPSGSSFTAAGTARIDLVNAGGFTGQVNSAGFTTPTGTALPVNIAGSSVDGAFYGPAAQEVGGGFRIVGGTPDQRIDIMGAFTGKKP